VFASAAAPIDLTADEMAVASIQDVTSAGFSVKVSRRRANSENSTVYETVNWFAVGQTSVDNNDDNNSFGTTYVTNADKTELEEYPTNGRGNDTFEMFA